MVESQHIQDGSGEGYKKALGGQCIMICRDELELRVWIGYRCGGARAYARPVAGFRDQFSWRLSGFCMCFI